MLYDLNIAWTPQTTPADLERTLLFSQSLGYNVVVLNHTLSAPVPSTITNPIPKLGPVHSSFSQSTSSASASTKKDAPNNKLPITLRRATVLISDPSINHRLPALAASYDLLAARPTTEKAFLAACTSMSEISLISLDLTTSFPFRFRPKPCMAAVNRGILFEICYSQLFSSTAASDPRARTLFIGNVTEIFRATRGRGIVLSSEAKGDKGGTLRAPADVVNLFSVWGLSNEKGLEALGTNPRSVVVNEGLKRRSFRGVVDIVQVEGKAPKKEQGGAPGEDEEDGENSGNNKKKQQKNQKPKNENKQQSQASQNGKRKHDGATVYQGGTSQDPSSTSASASASASASEQQQQSTISSKRQNKKMKLAQRAVADE